MRILQLAIRSLKKHKLYTVLNIIALGLSLTCVITLCRYLHQELNTDRFIRDLDRVYYVIQERQANQKRMLLGMNGYVGYETLVENSGIEEYSRFISMESDPIEWNEKKFVADIVATDSSFLKIFTYPILQAQQLPLLSRPNEAVITKKFANKLFGEKNPLGETLIHSTGTPVVITGVLDNPQTQVSFPFDLLIHRELTTNWSRMYDEAVRLYPGIDVKDINNLYSEYKDISASREKSRFQLYPVKDFYFDKQILSFYDPAIHGNSNYLNILSLVVILLLFIGLFNFINTYTTLILKRAREFGMKKVFGANLMQVYCQILFENTFMTFCALFFAWIMNELFSGMLWNYLGIPEIKNYAFNIALSLIILVLLPLITSVYPFIRYCYSPPVRSLKQVSMSGQVMKTKNKFLFLEYTITCALIIFSLFFTKQLFFMLNKDPGFNTENILQTQLLSRSPSHSANPEATEKFLSNIDLLQNEIPRNTLFKDHYFGSSPLEISNAIYLMGKSGEDLKDVRLYFITKEGLDFWGIKLLAGEIWKENDDHTNEMKVLINERAWKNFGFRNLDEAYLESKTRFIMGPYTDFSKPPLYKVIGIVEDFHIEHLAHQVPSIVLCNSSSGPYEFIHLSIDPLKKQESIHWLMELNEKIDNREFHYHFISDKLEEIYKKDRQITLLCSLFAFFAICISALGLFSLSLFDIRQKLPEVGIRKMNGAQPKDIFRLFMRKYMEILFYAFAIASVVSWLGLYYYLQSFAYKAPISWWIFAIALLTTGGITWITLFYQIRKAAASNPAEVIKSE